MKFFLDLSPRKLRIMTKKLNMLEGHADRFIEGIEYQKRKVGLTSPKKAVSETVSPTLTKTFVSEKPVPKKGIDSEGLPLYCDTTDEVLAATRAHSTQQGYCTLLDRKYNNGKTRIFRCSNVLTTNKSKLEHITECHRKCPYYVIWRRNVDKSLGRRVWKVDYKSCNFKHSIMCTSGDCYFAPQLLCPPQ